MQYLTVSNVTSIYSNDKNPTLEHGRGKQD